MTKKDDKKDRYGSRKIDMGEIIGKNKKEGVSEAVNELEKGSGEEKESFFDLLKKEEKSQKPISDREGEKDTTKKEGESSSVTEAIAKEKREKEKKKSKKEEEHEKTNLSDLNANQNEELIKNLKELIESDKETFKKLEKLTNLLDEASEEDPMAEILKDVSKSMNNRLDSIDEDITRINRQLENLQTRLDSLVGFEEKPGLSKLKGNVRKIALEIEMMPPNATVSVDELARRLSLPQKEVLDSIKELIAQGWKLEVEETTEKTLGGILSKKVTNIAKGY